MSFKGTDVPKPIPRAIHRKKSCNKSVFDRINDLCRLPEPPITRLDDRLFVSSLFKSIHELCRTPDLLTGIEDLPIAEQTADETNVKEVIYKKRDIKSRYYSETEKKTSFDAISSSKLFETVVKGKAVKAKDNLRVCENSENICSKPNKRTKSVAKSESKSRKTLKPILSIDLDITSKINKYSKQYQKPSKRPQNRKNSAKGSETNSQTSETEPIPTSTDSNYPSIPSPSVSVCHTMSYSSPATPISSSDGYFSQSSVSSCETTSSIKSQIRNLVKTKFETYGQHFQKVQKIKNESKESKHKKTIKISVDSLKKVLAWKQQFCSGASTPLHFVQYTETPPTSPSPVMQTNGQSDDESISQYINNFIQNEDFGQMDEQMNDNWNSLVSDLFPDFSQ